MLSLDERSENSALGKFVPEWTNLAHAQIRKKILDFEDIVQELRLSET